MKHTAFKILAMSILFVANFTIAHAQISGFILKDKYKGFETEDGKGYVEVDINDSTNIDSYIGAIYSTLAESYPRASIQTIGNRVVRMDATSLGIRAFDDIMLQLFVDFSIVLEVREQPDPYEWRDSLGVLHYRQLKTNHCVRISAPVVKKLTAYNPYYMSDVKETITNPTDMYGLLMEKAPNGVRANIGADFISEINEYIIYNIRAELNQNYYRTYKNGEYWNSLGRKNRRRSE